MEKNFVSEIALMTFKAILSIYYTLEIIIIMFINCDVKTTSHNWRNLHTKQFI